MRTFEDVITDLEEYSAQHEGQPFMISRADAKIALTAMKEQFESIGHGSGDLNYALEKAEAGDMSAVARLVNDDLHLLGVRLKPDWGEREALSAASVDALKYNVAVLGGDPESIVPFNDGRSWVASVMDYR